MPRPLIGTSLHNFASGTCLDIKVYLNSAIMRYHSLKMGEVNDTMRHLWNKTYQGTGKSALKTIIWKIELINTGQISTESKPALMPKVDLPSVHTTTE